MQEALSSCQKKALTYLEGKENLFLTGAAGSGKSFLLQHFLLNKDKLAYPVLASTGMAAVLVSGCTFHSFFGLGIMKEGLEKSIIDGSKNPKVKRRLRKAHTIIIDEISMLPKEALAAGEAIARNIKKSDLPWGGLRIIVVGDFAQLPPVSLGTLEKPWAFLDPVWEKTDFHPIALHTIMRTSDRDFLHILNEIRYGRYSKEVQEYLEERSAAYDKELHTTHLFARRKDVLTYNYERLHMLSGPIEKYATKYEGEKKGIEFLKRQSPLDEELQLKEGALIVIRKNDPIQRCFNGSVGYFLGVDEEQEIMNIELLSGNKIGLKKAEYSWYSPDKKVLATARNYPVNLAWAITIHRAQGASFDKLSVDIRNLWEEGHAYVALSRVKSGNSLFVKSFSKNSIQRCASPTVYNFYKKIGVLEPPSSTREPSSVR